MLNVLAHEMLVRHRTQTSSGRSRRARAEILKRLPGWDAAAAATVELLAGELVSNALVHTGAPARVRMFQGEKLRIEVVDASPRPPLGREASGDDEYGRGLLLVDALATDWGWRPSRDGGKVVWARLDAPLSPFSASR